MPACFLFAEPDGRYFRGEQCLHHPSTVITRTVVMAIASEAVRFERSIAGAHQPQASVPGRLRQPRATAHIWHQLRRWRAIDITVASVIAVASGIVFRLVDLIVIVPYAALEGVLPGLAGLLSGFWYFAGVLTMLIVRKPGAALYAETVAACLELVLGNQWGAGGSLVAGIAQGLLTEIAFLDAGIPALERLGRGAGGRICRDRRTGIFLRHYVCGHQCHRGFRYHEYSEQRRIWSCCFRRADVAALSGRRARGSLVAFRIGSHRYC
jgi:hypothetical protein